MSAFIVIKLDGDVPEAVGKAAYHAFAGVISACHEMTGQPGPDSFAEMLGFGAEPEGPGRRRLSVLERLYAKPDDEAQP